MATVEQVRTITLSLPRAYEALVRDSVKLPGRRRRVRGDLP